MFAESDALGLGLEVAADALFFDLVEGGLIALGLFVVKVFFDPSIGGDDLLFFVGALAKLLDDPGEVGLGGLVTPWTILETDVSLRFTLLDSSLAVIPRFDSKALMITPRESKALILVELLRLTRLKFNRLTCFHFHPNQRVSNNESSYFAE